jgi:plastocyanin
MKIDSRSERQWAVLGVVALLLLIFGILASGSRNANALPPQEGYTVQQSAGGTITGKLLWAGKPPAPHRIAVTVNPSACGSMKEMYDVHVEQGGVADAVVWIDNITHGKAFDFPKPVLDQKGCMFVPPVLLMQPGQLEVENSDSVTHNVQIVARFNRSSNNMMAPGAAPIEIPLMRPESILVRCNIHPWMQGYIVVAKNPYYALSGPGGTFTLANVPAGTYTLKMWQGKLGTKDQQVTVQAGKTTTVDFKLGG